MQPELRRTDDTEHLPLALLQPDDEQFVVAQTLRSCCPTHIAHSLPHGSVASHGLQIAWLYVTLRQASFDVVDETFFWSTRWSLPRQEFTVEQPAGKTVTRHSYYLSKPAQLPLQEQVLDRSDSSRVEQLSVWYLMPTTDAKDALQTTDVECFEGLDVTSVERGSTPHNRTARLIHILPCRQQPL